MRRASTLLAVVGVLVATFALAAPATASPTGCDISGTSGDDNLPGTPGDETICGFAGHDTVFGHNGDDTVRGGPGNDRVNGGQGDDILKGQKGNDNLQGDDGVSGNDVVIGGPGFDRCTADSGDLVQDCEVVFQDLQQVVTGDSEGYNTSSLGQDHWSFTGTPGTTVTVFVDTVSSATAFDIEAALSTDGTAGGIFAFADDTVACTFPPPFFSCPQFVTVLPAGGTYYLMIGGGSTSYATQDFGEYIAYVTPDAPIGTLTLVQDDGSDTFKHV